MILNAEDRTAVMLSREKGNPHGIEPLRMTKVLYNKATHL
jgi:hypothetical protein